MNKKTIKTFMKRSIKSIRFIPVLTLYSINEIEYIKTNDTINKTKKEIEHDILLFEGC
jgi:hypothetical protein